MGRWENKQNIVFFFSFFIFIYTKKNWFVLFLKIKSILQAKMDNTPKYSIQEEDYGEVYNETILKILGDELTYNEWKFYAKNINNTSYLTTKYESFNHKQSYWFTVYIDTELVLEKSFGSHHSCDMFIFFEELRLQQEEDEDEE